MTRAAWILVAFFAVKGCMWQAAKTVAVIGGKDYVCEPRTPKGRP